MERQRGFTLIEMALVIAIAGIMLTFLLSALGGNTQARRDSVTRERLVTVAKALANYAATNNRLPCSANPNPAAAADQPLGVERGSGVTNAATPCAAAANAEGIVPFRTLGLSDDAARDGWGRYITYRVSPAFTVLPTAGNAHANCRIATVWVDTNTNTSLNAAKARFCCTQGGAFGNATDVLVLDAAAGARVFNPTGAAASPAAPRDAANYAGVDVAAAATGNHLTYAFVLVSHGQNGHGSFLVNGTAARLDVGAGNFGNDEGENADGDVTFVDRARTDVAGATYFDDVVLWRHQNSLKQELGGSCALPR